MTGFQKLIWEFRGPDAKGTAAHHRIHLVQFALSNGFESMESGVEELNPEYVQAWLLCSPRNVETAKMQLKPHFTEPIEA